MRDADRIAKNITHWNELRNFGTTARNNINTAQEVYCSQSEAIEVLTNTTLVKRYHLEYEREDGDNEMSDRLADTKRTFQLNVLEHSSATTNEYLDALLTYKELIP